MTVDRRGAGRLLGCWRVGLCLLLPRFVGLLCLLFSAVRLTAIGGLEGSLLPVGLKGLDLNALSLARESTF